MKKQNYTIHPIGYVRQIQDNLLLEISEPYRPALKQLDGFSHLNVVWWCHQCDHEDQRELTVCQQPYTHGPAEIGIFATRSPLRPNPIALTAVAVLHLDQAQGRIFIPYIDAEPGTPILDMKPYHPCSDRIRNVSVPGWCRHWPQWYEDSASFDWDAEFV